MIYRREKLNFCINERNYMAWQLFLLCLCLLQNFFILFIVQDLRMVVKSKGLDLCQNKNTVMWHVLFLHMLLILFQIIYYPELWHNYSKWIKEYHKFLVSSLILLLIKSGQHRFVKTKIKNKHSKGWCIFLRIKTNFKLPVGRHNL